MHGGEQGRDRMIWGRGGMRHSQFGYPTPTLVWVVAGWARARRIGAMRLFVGTWDNARQFSRQGPRLELIEKVRVL